MPRAFCLTLLLLPAALVLASPCAAQSTSRDSAGIRIVDNARPVWRNGTGWTLATRPLLDIGAGDDSLHQFTTVMGAVRLHDGRIAIGDMSTGNVRVYDATGRYLASLGRRGQGPGEFRQVMGLMRLPGDTLVVIDQRTELEYFLPGGKHVRGVQALPGRNGLVLSAFYVFDDGSYARTSWPQGYDHSAGRWLDSLVVLRFATPQSEGTVISRHPAMEFNRTATLPFPQPVVFGPSGSVVTASGAYYVGFPRTYEIRRHQLDGKLDMIIRARWTPKAVTRADIERYKEFVINMGGEGGGAVPPRLLAQRKQMMDEAVFAPQLPAYSVMQIDADGNLWVRDAYLESYLSQGFSRTLASPTNWRIFDHNGRWLGVVTLPPRFNPTDIGTDYVLGVWHDADDVEHVRVYGLAKAGAG